MGSVDFASFNAPIETHRLRSADGRFKLELLPDHLAKMVAQCKRADTIETGGILVGQYSPDHTVAVLSEISDAPLDSMRSSTQFLRGIRGLQRWLDRFWSHKQEYYLGEWHYHPHAAPSPSCCDVQQMRDIAKSPAYSCPEPLLVILGGDPHGDWTFRAFVFVNGLGLVSLQEDGT